MLDRKVRLQKPACFLMVKWCFQLDLHLFMVTFVECELSINCFSRPLVGQSSLSYSSITISDCGWNLMCSSNASFTSSCCLA